MFVIEVDVDPAVSGPLHGELVALVSDALAARAPGYAKRVRVSWSDKQCGLCAALGHTTDEHLNCTCPRGLGYSFHRYPCVRAGEIEPLTRPGGES
jgi:hypothetical protein